MTEQASNDKKPKPDGPLRVPVKAIYFKPGEGHDFPGTGVSQVSNLQTGKVDSRVTPWTIFFLPAWQQFECIYNNGGQAAITRMLPVAHIGTWEPL